MRESLSRTPSPSLGRIAFGRGGEESFFGSRSFGVRVFESFLFKKPHLSDELSEFSQILIQTANFGTVSLGI